MRYEIIQTKPYDTAEFEFQSKVGHIGKAVWTHKTKKWDDWLFEIEFQQGFYKMVFGEADHSLKSFIKELLPTPPKSNPYQLYVNGVRVGEIFRRWGHYWMEIDGRKYSTCTVGFGSAGLKCLIFEGWFDRRKNPGGKQIALIETPNLGELLNHYEVFAEGNMAGLIALFFGLYWDINLSHYKKIYSETWGEEMQLYDPAFKGRITD